MSRSMLRLASLPLSLSLTASLAASLAACATQDDDTGPISAQESAATTEAVEGVVVAMAPATSGSPSSVAAAYRATYGTGGAACATVATDDLTYVTITFSCTGPLATTGSIHLQLTSPTQLEATADLAIGGVSIDGALQLAVPLDPSAARSFQGEITIAGPRRMLTADTTASWTSSGACVTYSASGSVAASGPARAGSATFDVTSRTVCRQ